MAVDGEATLQAAIAHPLLRDLALVAIDRLATGSWEFKSAGNLLSASEIAKLWQFRQDRGLVDTKRVLGVPETIASLSQVDGTIRLAILQSNQDVLALWLDDEDKLVGLILGETP